MSEWAQIIIGFIGGGALTSLVNFRINRKKEAIDLDDKKVDFAGKAVAFLEGQNDKYMALIKEQTERIDKLEKDVQALIGLKCERISCKIRIPQRIMEDLPKENTKS